MKIKNEYIEIQIGNKKYIRKNMLLNTYLKRIFDGEMDTEHASSEINMCYLKLDTPLQNIDYDSELNAYDDFDVIILRNIRPSIISTESTIKVTYNFDDMRFFYRKEDDTWGGMSGSNLNIFVGRQITGIGFGNGTTCFTYVDVSNMNIIINENELFKLTRVDDFISDGIVKDLEYPLHLINDSAKKDPETVYVSGTGYVEYTMAQLYSVGFGNQIGVMNSEYLINDVEIDRDDYSITFSLSNSVGEQLYPSYDIYPPQYPTKVNDKYLIFKYRLYRRYYNSNDEQYVITYLDEYYTMSMLNETYGDLEVKLKIERS